MVAKATDRIKVSDVIEFMEKFSECGDHLKTHYRRFGLTHDDLMERLAQLAILVESWKPYLPTDFVTAMNRVVMKIGDNLEQNGEALSDVGRDFIEIADLAKELLSD